MALQAQRTGLALHAEGGMQGMHNLTGEVSGCWGILVRAESVKIEQRQHRARHTDRHRAEPDSSNREV